ncbi:hypothetical protein [Neolewinella persica]|uniref:hypothetical protein n=1 Tax=Neolewinella persica TaxID=70998 RepID=UPI0003622614|nr:hypothetical protein [Neolewinella persica]
MNRDDLKKSGLLEQYVLGLTSRKESLMIQKMLEEDPEVKKDFDKLRSEFDGYVVDQGLQVPDDGREPRKQEDFDDLDYEMIMQMTARNHSLVKWRYGLGVLCLLLLCLCGFLFRISENNHSNLIIEKAEHAQDETSHHLALKHALKSIPEWQDITTQKVAVKNGVVLLHRLLNQHVVLLDLSHCDGISAGHVYHVFFNGQLNEDPVLVISGKDRLGLHPVLLEKETSSLQIYGRRIEPASSIDGGGNTLIADLSLDGTPISGTLKTQ